MSLPSIAVADDRKYDITDSSAEYMYFHATMAKENKIVLSNEMERAEHKFNKLWIH